MSLAMSSQNPSSSMSNQLKILRACDVCRRKKSAFLDYPPRFAALPWSCAD